MQFPQDNPIPDDAVTEAREQGIRRADVALAANEAFAPTPADAMMWLDTSAMDLPDQASASIRRALMFETLHAAQTRFAEGLKDKENDHG